MQNLSSEYAKINAVTSSFSQIRSLGEEVAGRNLTDLRQHRKCQCNPTVYCLQQFPRLTFSSCQLTDSSTSLKCCFLTSFIFCSSQQDETNDNMALASNCHYQLLHLCSRTFPCLSPSHLSNTLSKDHLSFYVCSTCFLLKPYSHASPLNPQQQAQLKQNNTCSLFQSAL